VEPALLRTPCDRPDPLAGSLTVFVQGSHHDAIHSPFLSARNIQHCVSWTQLHPPISQGRLKELKHCPCFLIDKSSQEMCMRVCSSSNLLMVRIVRSCFVHSQIFHQCSAMPGLCYAREPSIFAVGVADPALLSIALP